MEVAYPAIGMAATKSQPVPIPTYSGGSVFSVQRKKESDENLSNSMESAFLNATGIGEIGHLLEILQHLEELGIGDKNQIQVPAGIMDILNGWMGIRNEIPGVRPKEIVSVGNAIKYGKINKLNEDTEFDSVAKQRKLKL